MSKGDLTPGKTVVVRFNTHKADGTPITLAGTPAISVYKNSTTESAAGVTLTVDYDGRTGLHSVAIDTSADGTFYAAGNDFSVVITAGTVDGISVVGMLVGDFSLANRSALRPTTADRTLVVDAAGLADANTVKVGPTGTGATQTALNIGGTLGVAGVGLTNVGDARLAHLDADITSRGTGDATIANQTTINSNVLSRLPTTSYTVPPTTGQIVAAIKADADWQTILAGVNGVFDFDPDTGVLVLKDKSGVTTLATLTLTVNSDNVVTSRASA